MSLQTSFTLTGHVEYGVITHFAASGDREALNAYGHTLAVALDAMLPTDPATSVAVALYDPAAKLALQILAVIEDDRSADHTVARHALRRAWTFFQRQRALAKTGRYEDWSDDETARYLAGGCGYFGVPWDDIIGTD